LRAWQQLLQVLTHEIMNSLTPIKSLSQTAQSLLDDPDGAADLRTALDAIARRSEYLSSFVTNYHKVSQWPAPTMAPVDLQGLFNRLQQAVGRAWTARSGEATFELTSPSLRLLADDGQLEQVLLVLIQNAEQATAN
jgi:nitrogen fixation/metabolism regulation signal transduction histidine kinase